MQTPLNMTDTLDLLPVRAKKQILKNLVGLINQSIIGYARAHLRAVAFAPKDEVPTIDDYNELRAREQELEDHDAALRYMGFEVNEKPIVQLMRFTTLRDWLELQIMQGGDSVAFDPVFDAPFSVENSLDWSISRAPRYDDEQIAKLAKSVGRTFDQVRAMKMQDANDDRNDLIKSRDAILALYNECVVMTSATIPFTIHDKITDEDGKEVEDERVIELHQVTEAADIELLIASLPLQSQWKLAVRFYDMMVDIANRNISLMLRPRGLGSRDAVSDVRLIDAARHTHYQQLVKFFEQYGDRLVALAQDRGMYLPPLPEPSTEPIVESMNGERQREDDIKLTAEEKHDAESLKQPLAERLMKRAPRPEQEVDTAMLAALTKLNSKPVDSNLL